MGMYAMWEEVENVFDGLDCVPSGEDQERYYTNVVRAMINMQQIITDHESKKWFFDRRFWDANRKTFDENVALYKKAKEQERRHGASLDFLRHCAANLEEI